VLSEKFIVALLGIQHDVFAVVPMAFVPYTPPDDGQRVHVILAPLPADL